MGDINEILNVIDGHVEAYNNQSSQIIQYTIFQIIQYTLILLEMFIGLNMTIYNMTKFYLDGHVEANTHLFYFCRIIILACS